MALFRRRGWEPPKPSVPLLIHCAAPALPAVSDAVNPGGSGGAHAGSVSGGEDRLLEVGDKLEVSTEDAGSWRLGAREGEPLPDPPPEVWRPPDPPPEVRARLSVPGFDLLLELLEAGDALPATVLYGTTLADRIASLAEGVVHDREAVRVYGPGDWRAEEPLAGVDPREHVTIHVVDEEGGVWIHTHGLRKFGRPEMEVYDVPQGLAPAASVTFLDLVAYLIEGALIRPGESLGDPELPIATKVGGRDEEHWGEVPALELVDTDEAGEPQERGAARGLGAWARFDPDH